MISSPRFLIIDDNGESRYLLVKTLLRKFPTAILHECQSAQAAIEMVKTEKLSAIITHRTTDVAGIEILRALRALNSEVPIVMVSGMDRRVAAEAAGADRFLPYEEWLRIGTVVEELILARFSTGARPDGRR